jgi:hypothetical protein
LGEEERTAMQSLTIEARSLESAREFCAALSEFDAELAETGNGGYQVKVAFAAGNRAILRVLRALEDHVTERADGPAKLDLDGRGYTIHPATDPTD